MVHLIRPLMKYVPRPRARASRPDLIPIYTAINADAAQAAPEAFRREGTAVPGDHQAWPNAWYMIRSSRSPRGPPGDLHHDAIEALDRQLRKAIKNEGTPSPTRTTLASRPTSALTNAVPTGPTRNWTVAPLGLRTLRRPLPGRNLTPITGQHSRTPTLRVTTSSNRLHRFADGAPRKTRSVSVGLASTAAG